MKSHTSPRKKDVTGIFPDDNTIPPEIKFDFPVNQKEWLVNGRIRKWNGEFQTVLSPVCLKNAEGRFTQQVLGLYPLLSKKEAAEALDAAVAAYNNGRGSWPMMSVEERIQHIQRFVMAMKAVRGEVVKWIMWEIGKNTEDAEKEFDRTLLKAYQESFPKGVINIIYGSGPELMPPIMESGKVACLAFIGTSRVADILKKQHPMPHRLRSCLGLEAKNPAIILPDADLNLTVSECLLGALSYNGQRCTALKLLFVHTSIVDEFLAAFCTEVEKLPIGMPWTPNVKITPLPEDNKTGYLTELVEDAKTKGASVVNPSGGLTNNTFFFPAVLYPVLPQMRIFSEEQFGPVIPVVPFSDIEEVITAIINSKYGQQCSIFGKNAEDIAKLVDPLVNQVCRVNVNSQCQRGPDKYPFTGRKDSAEGTLSVSDALRVFSIRTLVAMKGNPLNKELLTDILKNRRSTFLNTDFIF
jgi:acyl-CoA reductase-like NAD-dependent aldehyde dehydrogenase